MKNYYDYQHTSYKISLKVSGGELLLYYYHYLYLKKLNLQYYSYYLRVVRMVIKKIKNLDKESYSYSKDILLFLLFIYNRLLFFFFLHRAWQSENGLRFDEISDNLENPWKLKKAFNKIFFFQIWWGSITLSL